MLTLLAQNIPGYKTDVVQGPNFNSSSLFGLFYDKFIKFMFPTPLNSDPLLVIGTLVSTLLRIATVGAGIVFFVQIIQAGFTMLTNFGDPAKIESGMKTIQNGVIGLIIVLTAFFIIQVLQYLLPIRLL